MTNQPTIYQVGGSLPQDATTYAKRKADTEIFQALMAGEFCYVLNSRQMGKSSLRVQTMKRLQEAGVACGCVDFTMIGKENIPIEMWYSSLIVMLVDEFNLSARFDEKAWFRETEHIAPLLGFGKFIESVLLETIPETIVIFIDEIDSIIKVEFKDDFFAFIRSCYNKRAENPVYNRLSFCLLGVATPADLIQDKQRTPFNIGRDIELTGFTFEEAKTPLLPGLVGKVANPEQVLGEILNWTGGQPFLTQKLCKLMVENQQASPLLRGTGGGSHGSNSGGGSIHSTSGLGSPLTPLNKGGTGVAQVARTQIIDNWVSQDKPEHLKTIRDRILRKEQRAGRLLGLYQQVWEQGSLAADGSEKQTELRLSGLVVERDGSLTVNNRIYGSVFDGDWVKQELARLRPYAEAFTAWVESGCKDESCLLRGVALENAQAWAKGKSLSDLDYQFLAAGQELDRRVLVEESRILAKAQKKAKWIISIGGTVLGLSLIVAVVTGIKTREQIKEVQTGARLEQQALSVLRRLPGDNVYYGDRELLYSAMETGQQLFNIVKDGRPLDNYPAISPLYALQQSLSKFKKNRLFRVHEGSVVSFSPDGMILATASDGTVRLSDLQGKQLALFEGHKQPVSIVSLSPDGKMLATALGDMTVIPCEMTLIDCETEEKTVRVWDLQGNQLAVLTGHESSVNSVSFSRDGKTLATASDDNTVRVWDLQGNQLAVLTGHLGWVTSVRFSRDGQRLASASWDNTVRVWDLQGNQLAVLTGHLGWVTSVRFSRDGQRLATASEDDTVRVWDLQGNQLAVLRGHEFSVNSVSFSRDGKTLATALDDGTVRLWDLQGNQLAVLTGHESSVNSVNFSRDGKTLATASDDNTVRLWDLQGKQLPVFIGHQGFVWTVSFSPDSKMLATASSDNKVRLSDVQGNQLALLKGDINWRIGVSFSPDSKMLATASSDNKVRVWDLQGNTLAVLKGHLGLVWSVSFSRDGKTLATASDDGTVRLWDLQGNTLAVLKGHESSVNSVSFSRDGKTLATASDDGTVRVWNLEGNQLALFKGNQASVYSVSFSRDGKILATASDDGTVRVWNLEGNQLALFKGNQDWVTSVWFSRDGEMLATASSDNKVRVWDLKGNPLVVLKGHQSQVSSVDFSRDGKMLATASWETVRVWDLQGNQLALFQGHQSQVNSVRFSPDGKMLVIASNDKTVRLWAVEDLGEMLTRGCKLIEDYFVENFEALESLTTCQDSVDKVAVAPGLVKQGEKLAKEVDVEGAIAKFQKAQEWNPELELEPETKAKQLAAPVKVEQGEELAKQGKLTKALSLYKQAQQLDPNLDISTFDWNTLCWFGSLHGYAAEVMDACEKAVAKAPEFKQYYQGVRGLARALTGDTAGAISDFQAYVDSISDDHEWKAKVQKWIDELRAGKNPFTEEVLKGLLEE
ncbi:AAA-like domain-containing protein [Moorena producens]|uniref:WD40 domain-containing protein n=1 Tax=Moorena producens TaxID=1155739 RepID=UPI003C74B6AD